MKQKLLALVCAVTLLLSTVNTAFALEGETTRAADTLYTLGLVLGDGTPDSYALTANATRGDAVTMLVQLAGAQQLAKTDQWISGFLDVPAALTQTVNYAAHQGWVSGVTVIRFAPSQIVTANAYCAFLLRMLGYSDQDGDFTVSDAAGFARRIGLISQSYDGLLTRGQLYAISQDALTFRYKDSAQTVIGRLIAGGLVSAAKANALGLMNESLTARQVADRLTAAVFQLDCYENQTLVDAKTPNANGSAFFISADGLAVTNYHCLAGNVYATATLVGGEQYPIERVLYYDAGIDIAVIQVSMTALNGRNTSAFAHLDVAGTDDIRAGDAVYTLSNPLGLGLAISSGIISDTSRVVERYTLPCIMDTADISQGSSGGALLNVYGQVIGVTSGAFTYGNNMYLAVPIDPVLTADLTGEGWTLSEVAAITAAEAKD